MKITVILADTDSGHVKVDTDPPIPKLVEMAKSKSDVITPALAYTMRALSSIMKDSLEQGQADGKIPKASIWPKFFKPRGHS